MISAAEALRLPSAQLTSEESTASDALETAIEAHVRLKMERRGCEYTTEEKRPNVIAEVNQRLKRAGYQPQWQALVQQGKFSNNRVHMGFSLSLAPTDEAYQAVGEVLSAGPEAAKRWQ